MRMQTAIGRILLNKIRMNDEFRKCSSFRSVTWLLIPRLGKSAANQKFRIAEGSALDELYLLFE